MKKITWLIFLLVLSSLSCHADLSISKAEDLLDNPAPLLANFDGLPSLLVHDCVHVITGDYLDLQIDLVQKGPEPFYLARSYCSSDKRQSTLGISWNHNLWGQFSRQKSIRHNWVVTQGHQGVECVYSGNKDSSCLRMDHKMLSKGMTNCASGKISARTNAKNTVLHFDKNKLYCDLRMGSGETHKYQIQQRMRSEVPGLYALREIQKANGNSYHFDYKSHIWLKEASIKNKQGQTIQQFKSDSDEDTCTFTSLDGRQMTYAFQKARVEQLTKSFLSTVESPYKVKESYSYHNVKLIKKSKPENRYLLIGYDPKGKVQSLKAPGKDKKPVQIYHFEYRESKKEHEGHTLAFDALDHLTQYNYCTKTFRISTIQKYKGPPYQRYSQETFHWGKEGTSEEAQLISYTLEDPEGIHFCRHYEYDKYGNIEKSWLVGNLSGLEGHPIAMKGAIPQNGDFYLKECRYTDDPFHLCQESHEQAVTTRYVYYKGTDLLKAKYLIADGLIRIREFFKYDDNAALKLHIIDDGTSEEIDNLDNVTERKTKRMINTTQIPIGLPEIIEEWGGDQLIKKTVNHYNAWGDLIEQELFDSRGVKAYSLFWNYDDHGNLLKETNALGETTTYTYDANDNRIYKQGPKKDSYWEFEYDYCNRLTCEKLVTPEKTYVKDYEYDPKGNKISETDESGNKTFYKYDELDRIIVKILPPVVDESKTIYFPEEHYDYDVFNHVTAFTDPKGQTTQTRYTIRSQPHFKQYPDGSIERREYTLRGELKKAVERDGSSTQYEYDYLSRPIKIKVFDPEGNKLKTTTKEYSAFHLIKEIDPEGYETSYSYDSAGRLIQERRGQKLTAYIYDSLGRQTETHSYYNEEEYLNRVKKYDNLDRVIEETELDSLGNLFTKREYSYDSDGHQTEVKIGPHTTTTEYDSLGHPVKVTDAEGHVTTSSYNYSYLNNYGVPVLCVETIDPLKNTSVLIYNALGKVEVVKKHNALGQIIQMAEYYYDKAGNRCRWEERVMTPNEPDRIILNAWTYDCMNQVKECAEAVAHPESKVTYYDYDLRGNVKKITKPNGQEIHFLYDSLNCLKEKFGSDFHYDYSYNKNDQLTHVISQSTETIRCYENDQLVKESLANDLTLNYTYDFLGRLLKITYPDQSFATYSYQGPHLKEIVRYDAQGQLLYQHQYTSYDLSGNLLKAKMAGHCGEIHYSYNKLNQITHIETPHWKESILSYDPVGNLLKRTVEDSQNTLTYEYTYDDLYQLTSEKGVLDQTYINDSLYNQIEKNHLKRTHNDLCMLKHDGEQAYSYDPNGNLKNEPDTEYTYDALDRLTSVTKKEAVIAYTYDFMDRRLSKKTPQEEVRYLYTHQQDIGTVNNTGKIVELRLLGKGKADIGAAIALELNGKPFVPLHDSQGNCTALLNLEGELQQSYRYSTFGQKERDVYGDKNTTNPWQYASKRWDQETNLIYFGKRYYNPLLNRWLTPDPAGFLDGMNLYSYLHNNPFRYVDPDGQFAIVLPFLTLAFGAAETTAAIITVEQAIGLTIAAVAGWCAAEACIKISNTVNQDLLEDELKEKEEAEKEKKKKANSFPENPDDLLPELPRDKKGHIYTSDNCRIRPEKHEFKDGDTYNERHHGQHYHVETKRDPSINWNKTWNNEKIKPKGYRPGEGTGFVPGETYPGIL